MRTRMVGGKVTAGFKYGVVNGTGKVNDLLWGFGGI
jgi:hypothetical protein